MHGLREFLRAAFQFGGGEGYTAATAGAVGADDGRLYIVLKREGGVNCQLCLGINIHIDRVEEPLPTTGYSTVGNGT